MRGGPFHKSHISIDRRHGIIRRVQITDAAAHDGARLREGLIDPNNTASGIRQRLSRRRFLARVGKVSRIHRRKPHRLWPALSRSTDPRTIDGTLGGFTPPQPEIPAKSMA